MILCLRNRGEKKKTRNRQRRKKRKKGVLEVLSSGQQQILCENETKQNVHKKKTEKKKTGRGKTHQVRIEWRKHEALPVAEYHSP